MEEITFLGEHSLSTWIEGIIWSFMGIALIKVYYYDNSVGFNWKYYLNDNIKDILLGILSSLIVLRMGSYVISVIQNGFGIEIPYTEDVVSLVIVISAYIQVKLHKNRKPISRKIKEEMRMQNMKCKERDNK